MTQQTLTTTCPMDCPDTCALLVDVAGDRVQRIRGGHEHPDTQGFICGKVSRFGRRLQHSDRLLHPMRRTGPKGSNQFERISWTQAIEEIAANFRRVIATHGAEAILPYHYGGSNGVLTEEYLDSLFFANLGTSRLEKTICAAPSTAARKALYGSMTGASFSEFVHARFILIWGANTKGSNIHLMPYIKEARKQGAFVVSVDPVQRFGSGEADLHLAIKPGTDLVLALALARYWKTHNLLDQAFLRQWASGVETLLAAAEPWTMERAAAVCGLRVRDMETLAHAYAREEKAMLRCGWGPERNINGGQAIAAILALPALLGKFGVRGSGFTMSNSDGISFDRDKVLGPITWPNRAINMTPLGQALLEIQDPPIQSLFIYNSNPVATCPTQNKVIEGLSREDLFTVVFDPVHTDSAAFADILLPATTFLEGHDLRKAYGSFVAGGTVPVIPPMGEAKTNLEVFSLLAQAMGFEDEPFFWDARTHLAKAAATIRIHGEPADAERIQEGKVAFGGRKDAPLQFVDVFPQKGTILIAAQELGNDPYQFRAMDQPGFPLAMVSPASPKLVSSSMGEYNLPSLKVSLHPDEAARRRLRQDQVVRVYNPLGEVHLPLEITPKVALGSALIPKGAWRRASLNGKTAAALCPDHLEPISQGACFSDARVEIVGL